VKVISAIIVFLLGLALAIYLGIFFCFIGGITQVIEGIKVNPVDSLAIVIGIVKVLSTSIVGFGTFVFSSFIAGIIFLKD